MKPRALRFLLGMVLMGSASAQGLDTLFIINGQPNVGRIVGLDAESFRLQRPLPPPPGSPAGAPPLFATVTVPRANVVHIEFAPDEMREEKLRSATVAQLAEVAALWESSAPWLSIAKSPAGRIGLVYGDLLLRSDDPANAQKALALFQKIEKETWNQDDLMLAKQSRLRAMVATGRAREAVQEARELEKVSEDPSILIEARYILAEAADKELRRLVEENPRWEEDEFVIPERHRLYNEALDLYLSPSLFFGSEQVPAARGLWAAAGLYQFTGESAQAAELARDLVTLYPDTTYAPRARQFLDALPPEVRDQDNEKEIREEDPSPSKPSHEK